MNQETHGCRSKIEEMKVKTEEGFSNTFSLINFMIRLLINGGGVVEKIELLWSELS